MAPTNRLRPRRFGALARALLIAQLGLLPAAEALAYETLASLPEYSESAHVSWTQPHIVYRVHHWGAPGVAAGDVLLAAELAFGVWSEPECSPFTFEHERLTDVLPGRGNGENEIAWIWDHSEWEARGFPNDAIAITELTIERGEDGVARIVEADLLLEGFSGAQWTHRDDARPELRSVRAVLAHEAGHLLGLRDVCSPGTDRSLPDCDDVPGARTRLMYPEYRGPEQGLALSPDDLAGVCAVSYPLTAPCGASCAEGTTCVDEACVTEPECVSDGGRCAEACRSDDDCSGSDTCEGSSRGPRCVAPPSGCTAAAPPARPLGRGALALLALFALIVARRARRASPRGRAP